MTTIPEMDKRRDFRIAGMDCAEEVAVLKRYRGFGNDQSGDGISSSGLRQCSLLAPREESGAGQASGKEAVRAFGTVRTLLAEREGYMLRLGGRGNCRRYILEPGWFFRIHPALGTNARECIERILEVCRPQWANRHAKRKS